MDYKIKKISEVNEEELSQFYRFAFPSRYKILSNHWKWYYKFGLTENEPIILEYNSKIIGMAGLIPENLSLKGRVYQATWFTDFYIIKEYRNKGFGKILTEEWMKICPIQITYCNEQSLRIFKKFDWKYNNKFYRKITPTNIFNLIPIIKKLNFNLKRYKVDKSIKFSNIKPNKIDGKNIIKYSKLEEKNNDVKNCFSILRDEDWFKWRFLDCPYSSDIYEFEYNDDIVVAHVYKTINQKRLNILYSHTRSQNSIIYDLLYDWCLDNNLDFIWTLNSDKMRIFKENFFDNLLLKKKINFAFWAKEESNLTHLEKGIANAQGSDSDLESILYQGE